MKNADYTDNEWISERYLAILLLSLYSTMGKA